MSPSGSGVAKATINVKSIGPGMSASNASGVINNTLKLKQGPALFSLAFSDRSLKTPSELTDVVANLDYKHKDLTFHGIMDGASKKYTLGATWAPKGVTDGLVMTKATWSNKDNMINGVGTFALAKNQKSTITFNQKTMTTAKYFLTHDSWVFEPSYNFGKAKFAMAVNKKVMKDTLRMSYDLANGAATAQWTHKPFTATLTSGIRPHPFKASLPNLSIAYENVYEF